MSRILFSDSCLRKQCILFVFIILFSLIPGISFSDSKDSAIPEKPLSWVNDYAQILTPAEKQELNQRLAQLESKTSTQIFVAIFPALPENFYLEDFTTKLFEKWRPGSNQNNNGVLLAIFLANRELRIEVGYGLEDVLTDILSHRIIDTAILPHFKNSAYHAGISQGIDAIMAAVAGKYQTTVPEESSDSLFEILFVIFIVIMILIQFTKQFRSSTTYSSRGYKRNNWGTPGSFHSPFSGSRTRGGTGPTFRGGFGGLSGGGGASGRW